MKSIAAILSVVIAVCTLFAEDQSKIVSGTVVGITDGDTVTFQDSEGVSVTVRMNGIDAPEESQTYGLESSIALETLVLKHEATLVTHGTDKYGRTIADLYVNGVWINLAMVKTGNAWHYKKYSTNETLAAAETVAKKEHSGLWANAEAQAPWDYRHAQDGESDDTSTVTTSTSSETVEHPVAENGSYYGQVSETTGKPKTTYVQGYTRKDGTYVRGHYRSK